MNLRRPHSEAPLGWNKWPHRMALLLVCATFPLIWVGGLVTTYEAGMAVPDWPSTYGYNLFLYPWQTWLFGPWDIFIEHGHRLLGAAVGLIAIALVVVTCRCDRRPWMRGLAVAALALVIFQGVLGGQRVLQNTKQLAQLHGIIGPTFLALVAMMLVATSDFWHEQRSVVTDRDPRFGWMGWTMAALAWTQLVLGSQLRHVDGFTGPGLFGWALTLHIMTAVVLLVVTILLLGFVWRAGAELAHVQTPMRVIGALVLLQLGLGLSTWVFKYGWPAIFRPLGPEPNLTVHANSMIQSTIVTAHQATGALILACATFMATRATRHEYQVQGATITPAGATA